MKKWYETEFCNKLAGWIAGYMLFAALYSMFIVLAWNMCIVPARQYISSAQWESVPCIITQSTAEKHWSRGFGTYWEPRVEFQYDYRGQRFWSSQFAFPSASTRYNHRGKTAVRDYPVGKHTVCRVDPNNPSNAVLIRENHGMIPGCLAMILFLIYGLVGAIITPILLLEKQEAIIRFDRNGRFYCFVIPMLLFGGVICWCLTDILVYSGTFSIKLALAFFGVLTSWGVWETGRYFIRTWKVYPPILKLTRLPLNWGGVLEFDWEVPANSRLESFELKLVGMKIKTKACVRFSHTEIDTVLSRHLQHWSAGRKKNKTRSGHVSCLLPGSAMELTLDSEASCILRLELKGRRFNGKICEWGYSLTLEELEEKS